MPDMFQSIATFAVVAFCAFLNPPISRAIEKPSRPFDISVDQGDLTVAVQDAPLSRVLKAIGERAGISIDIRGDLDLPISASFAGVPLEEGIRRLAAGYSIAFIHAEDGRHLIGIWIIGGSKTAAVSAEATPELGARIDLQPQESAGGEEPPEKADTSDGAGESRSVVAAASDSAAAADDMQGLIEEARGGDRIAIEQLKEMLAAPDTDAVTRRQAVSALAGLRGADIESALTVALEDDDTAVRLRAVRGLRVLATDAAAQFLSDALSGDADLRVRLAAVRALSSLPNIIGLGPLEQAASDPDKSVRLAAACGLAWLKDHSFPPQ